jgi:hypothetical protein
MTQSFEQNRGMPGRPEDDVTRRTRLAGDGPGWPGGGRVERGGFAEVSDNAVLALTLVATILALGTLALILIRA